MSDQTPPAPELPPIDDSQPNPAEAAEPSDAGHEDPLPEKDGAA